MMDQDTRSFEDVRGRLERIVEEVSAEDISLDEALKLYEEAVKLGLSACELSESDLLPEELEAEAQSEEGDGAQATTPSSSVGADAVVEAAPDEQRDDTAPAQVI